MVESESFGELIEKTSDGGRTIQCQAADDTDSPAVLGKFKAITHMLEVEPDRLVEAPESLLDQVVSVLARLLLSGVLLRLEPNIQQMLR